MPLSARIPKIRLLVELFLDGAPPPSKVALVKILKGEGVPKSQRAVHL